MSTILEERSGDWAVLGASNVSLGLAALVTLLRQQGPARIFVAAGHGRSFGLRTRVLGRTLCSHLDSALWLRLAENAKTSPRPLRALLFDIGNDLAYGRSPKEITGWVEQCLDRLADRGAQVVLGLPPRASLCSVGRVRFLLASRLLFPTRSTSRADIFEQVQDLEQRLVALARTRQLTTFAPPANWYGFDPIHVKRRLRSMAFCQILQPLLDDPRSPERDAVARTKTALRRADFSECWRWGRLRRTPQPCASMKGSELYLD